MVKYLLRRILQAIPTFFGITIISFGIMLLSPSDPVSLLTFDPNVTQERRDLLADRLGVNDPAPLQYLRWLIGDDWLLVADSDGDGIDDEYGDRRGILRGDFGTSFYQNQSPVDLIAQYLPATLELNIIALIVSLIIGIPIGIFAAVWRGGAFDNITRVIAVIGDAIPAFWLGLLLIIAFGPQNLDLLPMAGRCPPVRGGCPPIYARMEYLILPVFVIVLGGVAGWSRYMRATMLDTITSDYIRTAHAKGLSTRLVWFKHAARNALIPLATFLGPVLTALLGGSVIIERVFTWPGVGQLLFNSVQKQDYPVVMAGVVLGAVLTIIGYMISDILYAVFDPRIRFN